MKKHFNNTPRKTYDLKPPNNLNPSQTISYCIGYIVGDGTINKKSSPKSEHSFAIQVIGTEEVCEYIYNTIQSHFKIPVVKQIRKHHKSPVKVLSFTGAIADRLTGYIQKSSLPHLKRKWDKYVPIVESKEERRRRASREVYERDGYTQKFSKMRK